MGMKSGKETAETYFTCILFFTVDHHTEWHPTTEHGPFSKLSRGSFETSSQAHDWAASHNVHPSTYIVVEVKP